MASRKGRDAMTRGKAVAEPVVHDHEKHSSFAGSPGAVDAQASKAADAKKHGKMMHGILKYHERGC